MSDRWREMSYQAYVAQDTEAARRFPDWLSQLQHGNYPDFGAQSGGGAYPYYHQRIGQVEPEPHPEVCNPLREGIAEIRARAADFEKYITKKYEIFEGSEQRLAALAGAGAAPTSRIMQRYTDFLIPHFNDMQGREIDLSDIPGLPNEARLQIQNTQDYLSSTDHTRRIDWDPQDWLHPDRNALTVYISYSLGDEDPILRPVKDFIGALRHGREHGAEEELIYLARGPQAERLFGGLPRQAGEDSLFVVDADAPDVTAPWRHTVVAAGGGTLTRTMTFLPGFGTDAGGPRVQLVGGRGVTIHEDYFRGIL